MTPIEIAQHALQAKKPQWEINSHGTNNLTVRINGEAVGEIRWARNESNSNHAYTIKSHHGGVGIRTKSVDKALQHTIREFRPRTFVEWVKEKHHEYYYACGNYHRTKRDQLSSFRHTYQQLEAQIMLGEADGAEYIPKLRAARDEYDEAERNVSLANTATLVVERKKDWLMIETQDGKALTEQVIGDFSEFPDWIRAKITLLRMKDPPIYYPTVGYRPANSMIYWVVN